LTPEQVSRIDELLNQFIAINRPFLKPGYSLKDLATDIDIPLHHLSAFINQHYGIHFNEYINRYRVDHFKERIASEEWKIKKLKAIARESGFNNRNTFTIAFKKIAGQSPSEYMKSVKKMPIIINHGRIISQ